MVVGGAAGRTLPRRALGNTGLRVSVLGFGASPLGGVFGDVKEADAVAAVHRAYALGINIFDTSPFYGATKSESVLGVCLQGLPREEVVLCTKVGRYGDADFDFSAARVTASVHASLARLRTAYIDLIQCHDIEFGDLDQVVTETLPALAALRAEGLVRHVGITGLPLAALQYVVDRAPPGLVDVVLSYCHYCLNDTALEPLLPLLVDKGVGVISASPLAMGLLSPQGPQPWHPAPSHVKEACKQAVEHAGSQGVPLPRLALKFAVRNPRIATTLVGMSSVALVEDNVAAVLEALDDAAAPAAHADAAVEAREAAVLSEVLQLLRDVHNVSWPSGRAAA